MSPSSACSAVDKEGSDTAADGLGRTDARKRLRRVGGDDTVPALDDGRIEASREGRAGCSPLDSARSLKAQDEHAQLPGVQDGPSGLDQVEVAQLFSASSTSPQLLLTAIQRTAH